MEIKNRSRNKQIAWDLNVYYQGVWPHGSRERHKLGIAERLRAIRELEKERAAQALSNWRGLDQG